MRNRAFGTYTIAKICQVAPMTVGRWLESGKIPFFTTGGGNKRVWDTDLVAFLQAHNYPIPKSLAPLAEPVFLIADDDPSLRRLLRRIFQGAYPKSKIFEASNGYEVGERMSISRPWLLVLDFQMPGLDGLRVCARIRQNSSYDDVKIIMVTGSQTTQLKQKAVKAGADAFLEKPYDANILMKITGQLLRKRIGFGKS